MKLDKQLMVETLAERACDGIDLKDLMQMYYDNQVEYLEELSQEDLIEYCINYGYWETEEEVIEEFEIN